MPHDTKQLGAEGETIAAQFLKKSGHTILARNYLCPLGEIDIVTLYEGCIVFTEVKTRASDKAADPEDNITPAKQRQLARVAEYWLAKNRRPKCAYRFDALSVIISPGEKPTIRHIVEAFIPD